MTNETRTLRGGPVKEKGGPTEAARQGKMNMLQVAENVGRGKVVSPKFNSMSDHRKMAVWIDKLVEDAKVRGKPVAQMVSLTPELATVLLERNPANRKINETAVERYTYEIIGNRWTFNGEPLIVADNGDLNDGQHRCAAVVKAGKPIDVILIVGVPRESRSTLDQGKMRSAADYLSMGGHTNASNLAAAAGYAWQYRTRGTLTRGSRNAATKSEILNFVAENSGLRRSLEIFNTKAGRGLGGVSFLAFCHFVISAVAKREDADSFFLALTEGVNLGRGHPALYVRTRMLSLNNGRDMNAKAELIFKAWNAWRRGEKVDKIWLTGGALPALEA